MLWLFCMKAYKSKDQCVCSCQQAWKSSHNLQYWPQIHKDTGGFILDLETPC